MDALSPNFSYLELTRSQTALRRGIPNTPNDMQIGNLSRLCIRLLEPVRTILGVPLHVDSGFRSPELNAAIGGSRVSAHLEGLAADVIPIEMDLQKAFNTLSGHTELPIDQLIIECNAWLHIGMAPGGTLPRHQRLVASGSPGHWEYHEV